MKSSQRCLASCLALGLLSVSVGCSGNAANQGTAATPASPDIYPAGILSGRDAKSTIVGVYPVSSADMQSCCWLAPQARFRIFGDADVKTVKLTVYEPKLGKLATSHQQLSLLDANGQVFSSRPVATGLQTLILPVPRNVVGSGTVSVRIRMSASIVPKDAGVNGDTRALSLILQQVSAQ